MSPDPTSEPTAGLEEERDFLLDSLQDLERDRAAGEIGEPDYQKLKDDYTARAAAVLRALEARSAPRPRRGPPVRGRRSSSPAGRRPGTTAPPRRRAPTADAVPPPRRRRSLVVTAGVALVIVAIAGGSVALFSDSRGAGEPVTGSIPASTSERLSQAIEADAQGNALDALKLYDAVLADAPDNVQALAYKGWLLKRAGLADRAQEVLDRAVAVDPAFPDAHFFRGMLLLQDRNDPAAAVVEFHAFLDNNPPSEMVPAVQEVLKQAEAAAVAGVPRPSG